MDCPREQIPDQDWLFLDPPGISEIMERSKNNLRGITLGISLHEGVSLLA